MKGGGEKERERDKSGGEISERHCFSNCGGETHNLSYLEGNRLCGLVVGAPGYRFTNPEFDSQRYQIF
jgi:hypothetical protein